MQICQFLTKKKWTYPFGKIPVFQFNVCGTFYRYGHYFLSYGKGTKHSCKLDVTVNFFSTVAGNITVKAKRKSNLENYNLILCFVTSAFSRTRPKHQLCTCLALFLYISFPFLHDYDVKIPFLVL